MRREAPTITPARDGLDGIQWNVLGQTYVPKQCTPDSFAWHATLPIESFVPPHIHTTQDEYIYLLDGALDLLLDGQAKQARAGDLVRMPRGIPHGIFNNSGRSAAPNGWSSRLRTRCACLRWQPHCQVGSGVPAQRICPTLGDSLTRRHTRIQAEQHGSQPRASAGEDYASLRARELVLLTGWQRLVDRPTA